MQIGIKWSVAYALFFFGAQTARPQEPPTFATAVVPVLRTTCEPCHNAIEASGGLRLQEFEISDTLISRREVWDRILRRVKAGQMPPRGVPKPAALADMVAYLEKQFDANRKPDDYTFGPDSMVHEGIPQGTWDKIVWKSEIFPGTERFVWTYVPAQYDPKKPAALMVIQDGVRQYAEREDNRAAGRKAEYRVPTVLDNLIARGELPVIITVFIDPGSGDIRGRNGNPNFSNRSFEYDTLSDQYAQFLAKEILPPVEKKYNIRKDPAGRAIGGISSGAICAFTVAWNHPDWFGKVLSDVGSFTNIRGGQVYPQLVLAAERKPIKIHMQDGINDNRNPERPDRDWYLQNKAMYEALLAKGYEVKYVLGDGIHSSKHGGSILPDSLRWLWSDQAPK